MKNQGFYSTLKNFLLTRIDNRGLVVFRIIFGLLIFLESVGSIFTGWVKVNLIDPDFTFTFIGFEWLQPLPGDSMYYYYAVMGLMGLAVMFGFYYRMSLTIFSLMWTATYLMQKSAYNNHYYLLILMCLLMLTVPAHQYASLDVRRKPAIKRLSCPRWCYVIFYLQTGIVYTYAAIAKMDMDWMQGIPLTTWFAMKSHYPIVGPLLATPWIIPVVAIGGILYDGLITPLLLWKRTRLFALMVSIIFHLFNSAVFQIGIFPYLMIGITILFFPGETVRKFFFRNKAIENPSTPRVNNTRGHYNIALLSFAVYFTIQIFLPLRHHFYPGDVTWTEEGHRMSWRMMLRNKHGQIHFEFRDADSHHSVLVYPHQFFTAKQITTLSIRPDIVWQAVQYLKKHHQTGIENPEIYVQNEVYLNGRRAKPLVDPNVNMADVSWHRFRHEYWITTLPTHAP